jgi:hypothetical protein
MIVVRIIGGLGNQLFQYAAGLALSSRLGVELRLDMCAFETYRLRQRHLDAFTISAVPATKDDIARLKRGKGGWVDRALSRILPTGLPAPITYFKESTFTYSPAFEKLADDTYLDGYWQSAKYFQGFEWKVRRELAWRRPAPSANSGLEDLIRGSGSVSVHIRRGDYVSDPRARKLYETCTMDYYGKALEVMTARLSHPRCFVFSDEPEWAQQNWFRRSCDVFVPRGLSPVDDLRLMAMCSHHIIANSTFSWWGAWLNSAADKMVIAPRRWFLPGVLDDKDLIPEGWITIS